MDLRNREYTRLKSVDGVRPESGLQKVTPENLDILRLSCLWKSSVYFVFICSDICCSIFLFLKRGRVKKLTLR